MYTVLLSQGTILNAQKANDSRSALRVPFTQLLNTAIKVRRCHVHETHWL